MTEGIIPLWAQAVVGVLVVAGAFIALLGALGLVRLQSYFERVHSPSIIATLGCWFIMHATILFFSMLEQRLTLHGLLIAMFIAVTVPITTIFLMRAALFRARRNGQNVPPAVSRVVSSEPAAHDDAEHGGNRY
ncbi:monovalent cation/H(+) antiporter subunit G [Comamonas endophytica]|uniref:Monovalent cation/H(+) antiporter subunit G n=1 Tax=Comamonas endophytica TaxID=2949090 RepID=A0ABY6G8A0_9BURK|nr:MULTISPECIES: monovalent cation/H(+) antiporter subunit G [unclassified Acidovorax]MCD2514146.1 monovalent cation/H(+) antiporter subunit G [Acidovorax sp. D4N7]UYG51286.1 monovalent cation/H(+) antiporter subunit G [Acidovorax sp. 5MLIR]